MFKFTGCLLMGISVFLIICTRSIKDGFTYLFLYQTSEIFRILLFENKTAVTYPEIFSSMEKNKLWLYKNFDFPYQNNFFTDIEKNNLINKNELYKVKGMISQLGYRNAAEENEYISRCITILVAKAEFYRERYISNSKINRLCGISAGILLMLIII